MRKQKDNEIRELVNSICDSLFDYKTVKSLLIEIREMVPDNTALKDICNFIAHEKRDKGLAVDGLNHFYLFLLFHLEFGNNKKPIELYSMPAYIKDYLMMQLEVADTKRFKKELKLSKKMIKKIIEDCIKVNDKNLSGVLHFMPADSNIIAILEFLLKTYTQESVFDSENIIKQLSKFLLGNHFIRKEAFFLKKKDKLILCILLILHDKNLKLKHQKSGEVECYIASQYNMDKKEFYLHTVFVVNVPGHDNISLIGSVMKTNLISSEWCDDKLKTTALSGTNNLPHPDYKTFQALKINEDFKLCAAYPEQTYDSSRHGTRLYVSPKHGNDKANGSIGRF